MENLQDIETSTLPGILISKAKNKVLSFDKRSGPKIIIKMGIKIIFKVTKI